MTLDPIRVNLEQRLAILFALTLKMVEFDKINKTSKTGQYTFVWNKYNLGELMEVVYQFSIEEITSGIKTYFNTHAPDQYYVMVTARAFKSIHTYSIVLIDKE